ncbi:MAG: carboxylesterase family protein, partial [Pseudomonadota bacterium]
LPTLDPETERLIEQGRIVGFVGESGVHVWRGIPFAASTAGDNRWRAPQPPPGWKGVREAIQFAERCAQMTNAFDADEGLKPGLVVGSEDCLALNIFAPPNAQNASLPVMVWIHGGGNVWGKSSDYDGSRLAVNENVVVIAVQYRVGPLGWFAHEAIRESAITPHDAAASFAILDLIASLEWVRDNISVFGGDPKNVTIFGESAGGHNVAALLASPLSEGLFHRAILQSGFFDSVSLAEAEGFEGERANPARTIVERLNVETAEDLRALPVETLLRAYDAAGNGYMDAPRMIQDGVVLPTTPLREAFQSLDMFHNVPIMTGTNRDEMKLFYFGDERLTKKFLWLFVTARDQQFYDALSEYVTRAWRIRAVDGPASMMTAAGHRLVYAYRFDWDDSGRFLFMNFRTLFGAAHGLDIPFLFNNFEFFGRANNIIFSKKSEVDREHLSRAMGRYWASFARDGVPSSAGAPDWPPYGEKATFLRLDTDNDGGIEIMHGADSFEKIATDLEKDPRLDQESRCFAVEEIGKWMWLFDEPAYAEIKAETGCDEA